MSTRPLDEDVGLEALGVELAVGDEDVDPERVEQAVGEVAVEDAGGNSTFSTILRKNITSK